MEDVTWHQTKCSLKPFRFELYFLGRDEPLGVFIVCLFFGFWFCFFVVVSEIKGNNYFRRTSPEEREVKSVRDSWLGYL